MNGRTTRFFTISAAMAMSLASAGASGAEGQSPRRIALDPVQGKMTAVARVPALGDQSFSLGIPETIGSRERMLLNFPEVDNRLTWSGPAEDGSVSSEWTKQGVIRYSARLVPGVDFVDIEMTVENPGADTWHDVFAFNCLNPTGAHDFKDWELERTFMSAHGGPLRMAETKRLQGHMPTVGFYTHEQTPWGQESPFVRGFHATSPNRTDDSWIVTLSKDGAAHMAATAHDALFLFDNLDRCCIHSAPNFGDIGPGEKSTAVARLYLAKGGLEDFLARFEADRADLAARQDRARPRRPRLELNGLSAPPAGRFGVLGFRVRAPWMQGAIEQRFPETIHSSLGLHFIDHDRRDMPPLAMLEPFPAWEKDEATGEISYSHRDGTGLVFSGRARPYEDEVLMEYRIRNETGQLLRNVSVQMCTNLGPSEDFDPKKDVSRTFAWMDGIWTSFADTTPNLAREDRHPWILVEVKGTGYKGPRDNRDGWWVADQIADRGIAARVARDGAHLAAVRWDTAPMVMSNSRIPCLHAGPAGGVSLAPGEEVVWRGTIYLMKNDPDQLLIRYKGDMGQWPYPRPRPNPHPAPQLPRRDAGGKRSDGS